jgi:hypothetical protein
MRGLGLSGSRGRRASSGTLLAALALAAASLLTGVAAADSGERKRGGTEEMFAASTGNNSETEKTLRITKPSNSEERVVMSLDPSKLPTLQEGDRLTASAEVQLSTTCVEVSRRCIGRPYAFSPKMSAHLVLANDRRKTGGDRISGVDSKRCHQPRPNRNHHCVLVLKDGLKNVGDPANLPCPPDHCFVNLVASAESSKARSGNVVVVGADTPSGRIRQDKGRLNALVLRGSGLASEPERTRHRRKRRVPVADGGTGGRRVIYSLPLEDLRRGDAFTVQARQRTKIHHLPYNVFVGTQIVLGGSPNDVSPGKLPRRVGRFGAQVTEGNGFNCTLGNSAYESPCVTNKVGLLQVEHDALDGAGRPVTLYLNLTAQAAPKLAKPRKRDDAIALAGGFLEAKRYRDPQ